jgi:Ribonuclease G/E
MVPTMAGHHRIKAGDDRASTAVDFAEAVCGLETGDDEEAFPFGVVTRQFGPREGDSVEIGHGKPDGRYISLGRGDVAGHDPDGTVTVSRELSPGGTLDAIGEPIEAGDVAVTKFKEGRWWYATVYRDAEDRRKGTYVNVCTPVEVFPDTVRYVDLHVDVVKHGDGRVERVDDDELDAAVEDGDVSGRLAERARSVASAVENAL